MGLGLGVADLIERRAATQRRPAAKQLVQPLGRFIEGLLHRLRRVGQMLGRLGFGLGWLRRCGFRLTQRRARGLRHVGRRDRNGCDARTSLGHFDGGLGLFRLGRLIQHRVELGIRHVRQVLVGRGDVLLFSALLCYPVGKLLVGLEPRGFNARLIIECPHSFGRMLLEIEEFGRVCLVVGNH